MKTEYKCVKPDGSVPIVINSSNIGIGPNFNSFYATRKRQIWPRINVVRMKKIKKILCL